MPTTTITTLQATEAGALDGHKVTCTCGTVLTTSLGKSEARSLEVSHLDWHARREASA